MIADSVLWVIVERPLPPFYDLDLFPIEFLTSAVADSVVLVLDRLSNHLFVAESAFCLLRLCRCIYVVGSPLVVAKLTLQRSELLRGHSTRLPPAVGGGLCLGRRQRA